VELLLKHFLQTLEAKMQQVNQQGKKAIQEFCDFLMGLCCSKILDIAKSNFVQYVPLFVVLRAKKHFEAAPSALPLDKNSSCEVLFTTCFVSHLIQRSFPAAFEYALKRGSQDQRPRSKFFSTESRMRAWNYLASLLSQPAVIDHQILIKSLRLILDFQAKSHRQPEQPPASKGDAEMKESESPSVVSQQSSKLFSHCFVQGML
jgi:hypothetical protein